MILPLWKCLISCSFERFEIAAITSPTPRNSRACIAFGVTRRPAPNSLSSDACSYTDTLNPWRCNDNAAVNPPIPAPMTMMWQWVNAIDLDKVSTMRSTLSPGAHPLARSGRDLAGAKRVDASVAKCQQRRGCCRDQRKKAGDQEDVRRSQADRQQMPAQNWCDDSAKPHDAQCPPDAAGAHARRIELPASP